jgi:hypothetical protein
MATTTLNQFSSLQDARGTVLRAGHIYGTTSAAWQIVRSRCGRVNQCDCELAGELVKTCSRREADAWARWCGSW